MTEKNDKIKSIAINYPSDQARQLPKDTTKPAEKGGPKGPEPTRYGDWEKGGKCVDF